MFSYYIILNCNVTLLNMYITQYTEYSIISIIKSINLVL